MLISDLKIGDIVEGQISGEYYLAEIIGIEDIMTSFPIKALIPRNISAGDLFYSIDEVKESSWRKYINNIDNTKCKQHRFYPFRIDEIMKVTDQRW